MSNHVTKLTRSSSSSSSSSPSPSPSSPISSKTVELESPRTAAAAVAVVVKEDVQKLQYDALLHLMMTQGISWDYLIYCSYNDIFKLFKPYFNALYSDHLLIITQELDLLNTKVLNEIKTTDPYKELHTDLITTMNGRITQELQTFNFTLQRRAMTLLPTKTFEFEQPIDTSSMYVFHLLKYSQGITTKANFYENAKNGQLKTNHVTFKQRVLPNRIKYLVIYMLTILVVIFSNLGGLFTDNLAIIGNSIMFSILLLTIFVDFNETKRINTQVILYLLEENIFNKTIFLNLLLKMCYA